MTSREALETLVYYASLDASGFEPHMKRYGEIIEKDLDKLSQLEDIEDKLGCPIELYYKMCVEGTELYSLPHLDVIQLGHKYIYYKDFEGNAVFCLMLDSALTPLYYAKDYGKTWALTKEELEK